MAMLACLEPGLCKGLTEEFQSPLYSSPSSSLVRARQGTPVRARIRLQGLGKRGSKKKARFQGSLTLLDELAVTYLETHVVIHVT